MKSIEEQTRGAAEQYAVRAIDSPSIGGFDDIVSDFEAGAEWERRREKWISVEDELPSPLQTVWISDGEVWTSLGCRTEPDTDGLWCWAETNGIIYEQDGEIISECEADDLDVRFWHPIPEPPKQKEDNHD